MKNQKKLEDFIQQNREEFDEELPKNLVWENVQTSFSDEKTVQPRVIELKYFRLLAASFAFVVCAMLVLYFYQMQNIKNEYATKENTEENLAQNLPIDEEFVQAENYYVTQISNNRKLLQTKELEVKSAEVEDVDNELKSLEIEYRNLKDDLLNGGNPKIVADAMLENLRIRNEILEEQILIVEQITEKLKKSNENQSKNSKGI